MPASFIGKVATVISLTRSVAANSGNTQLYYNNTYLTNGKTYIVTAEVTFRRTGNGGEGSLIYLTNGSADNSYGTYIGLPFAVGFTNDYMNTAFWSTGRGGLTNYVARNSAQAVISNGVIKLVCVCNTDDINSYEINITAIECDSLYA